MSTIATKTPKPTPRPSTTKSSSAAPPKSNPSSTPKTQSPAAVDKVTRSSESKGADKTSDRASSIIAGLQNWGTESTKTEEVKKGAAEPMTLDKGQLLRRGAEGDKVKQLQELLNSQGAQLDPDGKFGAKTQEALKKFQKSKELGDDGVFGPKSLEALNGAGGAEKGSTDGVKPVAEAEKSGQEAPVDKASAQAPTGQANGGKFSKTRESLNKLPAPLQKYADTYQRMGEKYGVDPRFLAAISAHETGNGTSSAFRNKKNAMGISNRKGPTHQPSVEASIERMAKGLANPQGYYKGKTTIGGVANIYAPVGAGNDPNGLNGYWAKGVANNFRKYGGDPSQQVIFR